MEKVKREKNYKGLKSALIVLILVLFLYGSMMSYFVITGSKANYESDADVLIVLGAKVWGDQDNPVASPVFKERLDAAYDYMQENPDTIVIISGGKGDDEPVSEGQCGFDYLKAKGIDKKRLIVENKAVNTVENIRLSMDLHHYDKVLLVSNDYHIYRSVMLAHRLGYQGIEGLPAKSKTSDTLKSYVREIMALSYHFLFTHF